MKEFIRRWSNWWILNPRRKQLDDAFEKELNELIEREVALRIRDVVGRSERLKCGNSNPPCSPNIKFGCLECTECNWSE